MFLSLLYILAQQTAIILDYIFNFLTQCMFKVFIEIRSVFSLLLWICRFIKTKFSCGFLMYSIVVEHLGIASKLHMIPPLWDYL